MLLVTVCNTYVAPLSNLSCMNFFLHKLQKYLDSNIVSLASAAIVTIPDNFSWLTVIPKTAN